MFNSDWLIQIKEVYYIHSSQEAGSRMQNMDGLLTFDSSEAKNTLSCMNLKKNIV